MRERRKAKEQKEEGLEKEFRQERERERRGEVEKKEKDPNTFCT